MHKFLTVVHTTSKEWTLRITNILTFLGKIV